MVGRVWVLAKDTVEGFIEDEAMSRGAAIAYYTIFSIAPLLLIATAIAGIAFGDEAVRGAVAAQLEGLLGRAGAEAVQAMIQGAANKTQGTIATVISVVTLLLTASGVFGELQSALNLIWLFVYGDPEVAPIVTGYLGLLLLGAGFISIGLFLSNLTRNQIVAGLLTYAVLLMLLLVAWVGEGAGPVALEGAVHEPPTQRSQVDPAQARTVQRNMGAPGIEPGTSRV